MRNRDDPSSKKAKKSESLLQANGWGSWAGEGAPPAKPLKNLPKHLQLPVKPDLPKRKRQDDDKKGVIMNEKRVKRTAKYQIENIPYPFVSREQYDQAMSGSIGKEWNVTSAVKELTRKEVITRAGKIIKPLSIKAKVKRPPAKF
jgi:U3 small nucleolar RNA-associated protein 14